MKVVDEEAEQSTVQFRLPRWGVFHRIFVKNYGRAMKRMMMTYLTGGKMMVRCKETSERNDEVR